MNVRVFIVFLRDFGGKQHWTIMTRAESAPVDLAAARTDQMRRTLWRRWRGGLPWSDEASICRRVNAWSGGSRAAGRGARPSAAKSGDHSVVRR
jgi:hypothetical protein